MDAGLKSQILSQGMDPEVVNQQIGHFQNGFPFLKIVAPATPGNGIKVLSEKEINHFKNTYPEKASQIEKLFLFIEGLMFIEK